MTFSKIHPIALGIAVSVPAGLAAFFAGIIAFIFYSDKPIVGMMGTLYLSYNPSIANACLGAAIVFIYSFVACYVITWIYNFLLEHI
jgi:hypothetical protein